jgi:hypothetical protein
LESVELPACATAETCLYIAVFTVPVIDFAVRKRKEKEKERSESREEKSEWSPKAKCWTYCDEGRASKLIRKPCGGNTHLHLSKLHT